MNTKLKCLLVDDELPGLTYLKMLCEQLPGLEVVKAFNDPVIFLKEHSSIEYDFCILDIEMPDMNGLQLATLIEKPIIFTTAYKEYAAEAFDINAVDYVRKPVKKERLQQAVQKIKHRLINNHTLENQFVRLNTDQGKALIYFNQITYIKTSDIDSRDKYVLLQDQAAIILKNISFEKLQQILPPENFIRVNKKEMIALKVVQLFSSDEITTNLQTAAGQPLKVVLSEAYRKDFIQKIQM